MEQSVSDYLNFAINNPENIFKRKFALRCCYENLQSLPDELNILDYGTGPSLHEIFLMAPKASEIVLSDYSSANRDALKLWLDDDPAAFDWLPYFNRRLQELEGGGEQEVLERVKIMRQVVRAVVHCDITMNPPIEKGYDDQYDLINSSFCLCAALKSLDEYRQGVQKLAKLLKPGGTLMIYECEHKKCHQSHYLVGDQSCPYIAVTSDFVAEAFGDAGLKDISVRKIELDSSHPSAVKNPNRVGYFHITGKKLHN